MTKGPFDICQQFFARNLSFFFIRKMFFFFVLVPCTSENCSNLSLGGGEVEVVMTCVLSVVRHILLFSMETIQVSVETTQVSKETILQVSL